MSQSLKSCPGGMSSECHLVDCFGTMEFYDFPSIGNIMDYSGLMDFSMDFFNGLFHSVGNGIIIPTDEVHHFSEG